MATAPCCLSLHTHFFPCSYTHSWAACLISANKDSSTTHPGPVRMWRGSSTLLSAPLSPDWGLQAVTAERWSISFLLTQFNNSSHLVRIARRASEGNRADWAVGTKTSCQHKTVGVSLESVRLKVVIISICTTICSVIYRCVRHRAATFFSLSLSLVSRGRLHNKLAQIWKDFTSNNS